MTDTEIYGCDYASTGFVTSDGDVGCVSELDNAVQAIRNRLLTRVGTYPSIDDEYGSEMHEVLGEKLNNETISELEVYINDCMLDEPRVYGVTDLEITVIDKDSLRIQLQLQLVDGSEVGFEEVITTLG